MEQTPIRHLQTILAGEPHGARLVDNAQRLWRRVQRFMKMGLVDAGADADVMELVCHAVQLPLRQSKIASAGRAGRLTMQDRVQQTIELLVNAAAPQIEQAMLDRVIRLLEELPRRTTANLPARLLADVINLDDFGMTGLMLHAIQLTHAGEGLGAIADSAEKRELYGYWQARLKDSFYFEPIREIARRRMEHARQTTALLMQELREDQP